MLLSVLAAVAYAYPQDDDVYEPVDTLVRGPSEPAAPSADLEPAESRQYYNGGNKYKCHGGGCGGKKPYHKYPKYKY